MLHSLISERAPRKGGSSFSRLLVGGVGYEPPPPPRWRGRLLVGGVGCGRHHVGGCAISMPKKKIFWVLYFVFFVR